MPRISRMARIRSVLQSSRAWHEARRLEQSWLAPRRQARQGERGAWSSSVFSVSSVLRKVGHGCFNTEGAEDSEFRTGASPFPPLPPVKMEEIVNVGQRHMRAQIERAIVITASTAILVRASWNIARSDFGPIGIVLALPAITPVTLCLAKRSAGFALTLGCLCFIGTLKNQFLGRAMELEEYRGMSPISVSESPIV